MVMDNDDVTSKYGLRTPTNNEQTPVNRWEYGIHIGVEGILGKAHHI